MPTPWSSHRERHHAGLAPGADPDGVARAGEADGVGEKIVEHLPHPGFVGDEFLCIVGNANVDIEACTGGAVAHAQHGRIDQPGHLDRRQLQLQRAGVDGGQVEDVVDDGEQRAGGGRDVVEILALLAVERSPVRGLVSSSLKPMMLVSGVLQLIGHVADELALEPVAGHQRLVALDQRALVALGIGDVDEGDERSRRRAAARPRSRSRSGRAASSAPRSAGAGRRCR